ncbi:PqqD family protein [Tistrella mobilis]|uniref:PqqD family protein n=1 Tax=Tistrella mobilis TaxID=171437 RepID=UPI0035579924
MARVTLDHVVVQKPDILSARAEREILAMDEETGNCFAMGGSGAVIWEAAETPVRIRDICTHLQRRYRIDEASCTSQTLAYVDDLVAEGMLLIVPETV